MKAREVMDKRVTAATPRAIGRDLAQQMLSGIYSGLPVVDASHHIIGVVTEFDLLKAITDGKDLQTVKANEIMSRPAICVEEDDEIEMVIAKMTTHNFIRIPVVRDGKLVGLISRAAILSHMLEPERKLEPACVTLFDGK